jgi:CTP synthase (UTP-ammonia lyase)
MFTSGAARQWVKVTNRQINSRGVGKEYDGRDIEGELRVVEMSDHPFFIATLFQPGRPALSGVAHPVIRASVRVGDSQKRRASGAWN